MTDGCGLVLHRKIRLTQLWVELSWVVAILRVKGIRFIANFNQQVEDPPEIQRRLKPKKSSSRKSPSEVSKFNITTRTICQQISSLLFTYL